MNQSIFTNIFHTFLMFWPRFSNSDDVIHTHIVSMTFTLPYHGGNLWVALFFNWCTFSVFWRSQVTSNYGVSRIQLPHHKIAIKHHPHSLVLNNKLLFSHLLLTTFALRNKKKFLTQARFWGHSNFRVLQRINGLNQHQK